VAYPDQGKRAVYSGHMSHDGDPAPWDAWDPQPGDPDGEPSPPYQPAWWAPPAQSPVAGAERPGFLPAVEAGSEALGPAPEERGPVLPLALGAIGSAVILLVSAFLPWVSARLLVSTLGQTLDRDLGDASGVSVDGTGQLIPVLALIAIAVATWGILARNARISMLTAVPGALALVCCGTFLLRLGHAKDALGPDSGLAYRITLSYGWFVTLATSLLVIGLSLATPLTRHRPPAPDAQS
jgi:hypothetical protein